MKKRCVHCKELGAEVFVHWSTQKAGAQRVHVHVACLKDFWSDNPMMNQPDIQNTLVVNYTEGKVGSL